MADTTKIEWTDATWNPITGCTLVDAGCDNCYAAELAATRLKNHPSRRGLTRRNVDGVAKFNGRVRFNEQWLDQPLRWHKPRMIFVCAHGDLFHPSVPDEWIDKIFAVMALCPQHTFQVLTKRPERAEKYLAEAQTRIMDLVCDITVERCIHVALSAQPASDARASKFGVPVVRLYQWPLHNVWLGTSISDQPSADKRIPDLLACPAAVRFVSAEPLLGPVDMLVTDQRGHDISALRGIAVDPTDPDGPDKFYRTTELDWVIVGGESGKRARPMHPDWVRSLRDQCEAAGTAFFFKQWGNWIVEIDRDKDDPDWRANYTKAKRDGWAILNLEGGQGFHGERVCLMKRSTKGAAGRLLDGREWNGMPS